MQVLPSNAGPLSVLALASTQTAGTGCYTRSKAVQVTLSPFAVARGPARLLLRIIARRTPIWRIAALIGYAMPFGNDALLVLQSFFPDASS